MCHNYWPLALDPRSHKYWAQSPRATTTEAHAPTALLYNKRSHSNEKHRTTTKRSPCLPQLEKSLRSNEAPVQSKINHYKRRKTKRNNFKQSLNPKHNNQNKSTSRHSRETIDNRKWRENLKQHKKKNYFQKSSLDWKLTSLQ